MNHSNEKGFWKKHHGATGSTNSSQGTQKVHKQKLKDNTNDSNTNNNIKGSKEERNYRNAFNSVDANFDGRITILELKEAFRKLGNVVSDDDVAKMIQGADLDKNGTVEYSEFVELMKNFHRNKKSEIKTSENEAYEVFKAFDHNGDDMLDFNEIKSTMIALGEQVTDEDVTAMIIEADLDRNGKVDFSEFKRIMEMYKTKQST